MLNEIENGYPAIEEAALVQPLPVAPGHEEDIRIHAVD
jgi:hypothetical protein